MTNYVYAGLDSDLDCFAARLESRIGDSSGDHEKDYADLITMLAKLKRHGSLLDIGAGIGWITGGLARIMTETVALEPDPSRWELCRDGLEGVSGSVALNQTTAEYIGSNPDKKFDFIVLGMVLQHVSTSACRQILSDVSSLMAADGIAVISTTHTLDRTRGFTFADATAADAYISMEQFDSYAEDHGVQSRGLPVHRFSKTEFLDCLNVEFEVSYWRQMSYCREGFLAEYAALLGASPDELRDVGYSQFAVVQHRSK